MAATRPSWRPAWLTRNVVVLSAVSFAQDSASELLYPVLPLLLTVTFGAPAAVVGLVEGVAEGSAAVTKYVSGRYSDRVGRKPLIGLGYGMAAVGKLLVALSWAWPVVLVGRVVDRLGKGTRGTPRDALLAAATQPGDLGRVFGFHRAMDTAGAVVGPLLGLVVLAATGGNLRVALWVAVVPAVVSALLVGLVHEQSRQGVPSAVAPVVPTVPAETQMAAETPVPAAAAAATTSAAATRSRPHRSPLPPGFVRLVVALAVVALVNLPDALLLLRVSQVGFTAAGVAAVYVVYNLVYALGSYPAGALSERWPRHRVYALGLACFAVGVTGLGVVHGAGWVVLLMAVYGGFNACTDGVGKAWVSAVVPPDLRGRAQGVFQGVSGAAVLVAGLWAGLAWGLGRGSGTVPLVAAGLVAGAAAVALATAGRRLTVS